MSTPRASLTSLLPHELNRSVLVRATPDTVFRFFTDSTRWARWWGEGSTVDARPGGAVRICYPGGIVVEGEVLEVNAPSRFVFTYGFASGTPIAAGSSRVSITLAPDAVGTRLTLTHEFAESDASVRDEHVQGWRYQLSMFANVVANEVHADAADTVDRWFAAWAEPDAAARETTLTQIASASVQFSNQYSALDSRDELLAHITAAQRFMPGVRLERNGPVRHCQGIVLANWIATGADQAPVMQGTNLFVFAPDGTLESVTGFTG